MAQILYDLRLYDCNGAFIYSLQDIISFTFNRKANDLGICTVTLTSTSYNIYDFNKDYRLEIYRHYNGKAKLIGDTCWFLRKYELDVGSQEITLTFYDTIHLLTRRYAAWSGRLDPGYVTHMLEEYDSMMHLTMYYNYGQGTTSEILLADELNTSVPNVNLTDLNGALLGTIASWQYLPYGSNVAALINRRMPIILPLPAANSTIGGTEKFEHLSVLEVLQNIANVSNLKGEKIYFDIVYSPATPSNDETFTFRTWVGLRGTDRTQPNNLYIVGPEYGNLIDGVVVKDWEKEATIAYMAGSGENETRIYASAKRDELDNCPFYPIEIMGSESFGEEGSGFHNPPEGISAAQLLLAENAAIETLTGTIINTDDLNFFENVKPYDVVIANYKDFQINVALDEYEVNVDNSGEEIKIPLGK